MQNSNPFFSTHKILTDDRNDRQDSAHLLKEYGVLFNQLHPKGTPSVKESANTKIKHLTKENKKKIEAFEFWN